MVFGVSVDRRLLVIRTNDGHFIVWDTLTNTSRSVLHEPPFDLLNVALSSNGQWALGFSTNGTLQLWATTSGKSFGRLYADGSPWFLAGVNDDATQIFGLDDSGRLWLWSATHDDSTTTLKIDQPQVIGDGFMAGLNGGAFSGDGQRLA